MVCFRCVTYPGQAAVKECIQCLAQRNKTRCPHDQAHYSQSKYMLRVHIELSFQEKWLIHTTMLPG